MYKMRAKIPVFHKHSFIISNYFPHQSLISLNKFKKNWTKQVYSVFLLYK